MTITAPKEHPILFSTEMVQAILAGRKTQTRRIVNFPKQLKIHEQLQWEIKAAPDSPGYYRFEHETKYGVPYIKCKYSIGDTLWAREGFYAYDWHYGKDGVRIDEPGYIYRADTNDGRPWDMSDSYCENEFGDDKKDWPKWKPSIFMPYDACRIKLKITNIRVERVCDISEKDAIAEGVERINSIGPFRAMGWKDYGGGIGFLTAKESYKSLWIKINSPETWNNWVWVYDWK